MTKVKICGITRAEDAVAAVEAGADYLGFVFAMESPRYVDAARVREIVEIVRGGDAPLIRPSATFSPRVAGGEGQRRGLADEGEENDGERNHAQWNDGETNHGQGNDDGDLTTSPFSPREGGEGGRRPDEGGRIGAESILPGNNDRHAPQRPLFVGVFRNTPIAEVNRIADEAGLDLIQLHGDETDDDVRSANRPVIRAFRVRDAVPDTNRCAADFVLFDTFDDRRPGGTGKRFDWSLLSHYERRKPFFLAGGITPDNAAAAVSLLRPDALDVSSGVERAPGVKDHDRLRTLFERIRRS